MRLIIAGLMGLIIHIASPAIAVTSNAGHMHIPVLNHQSQLVQLRTDRQIGATHNSQADKRQNRPIGQVDNVDGVAFIIRLNGVTVLATTEMEVFLGDTIKTAENTVINLTFIDNTRFALGEEGEMVIDELVFSPPYEAERSLFTIVQGVFSFLSGKIAKTDTGLMLVQLPVATVGVRGTKVVGRAAKESHENSITLLPEEDGSVGEITVQNSAGTQILNQPFQTSKITSISRAPTLPATISEGDIKRLYGTVSQSVSLNHTTGSKAQRGSGQWADSKKTAAPSGKQATKFSQNKENLDNQKQDKGEESEPIEKKDIEKEDDGHAYNERAKPTKGDKNSLQDGQDVERNSEPDTQVSTEKKDSNTNELVETICAYESLCDGEKLNWKGWSVLAGIIILFCGLVIIFVVLLP